MELKFYNNTDIEGTVTISIEDYEELLKYKKAAKKGVIQIEESYSIGLFMKRCYFTYFTKDEVIEKELNQRKELQEKINSKEKEIVEKNKKIDDLMLYKDNIEEFKHMSVKEFKRWKKRQ